MNFGHERVKILPLADGPGCQPVGLGAAQGDGQRELNLAAGLGLSLVGDGRVRDALW